jgi:hypothetical protein
MEWNEVQYSTIPSRIERTKVVRHTCFINGFQIFSPWKERNTHVAIFSYSTLTFYKWRIHRIFILETTLLVGFECIKHSACEKLHLCNIWGVFFLIPRNHLAICTLSTEIVITSCSKVEWMHRLFGMMIHLIIFQPYSIWPPKQNYQGHPFNRSLTSCADTIIKLHMSSSSPSLRSPDTPSIFILDRQLHKKYTILWRNY